MKHCPTCGREYADDALKFCAKDGGTLAEGAAHAAGGERASVLRAELQRVVIVHAPACRAVLHRLNANRSLRLLISCH